MALRPCAWLTAGVALWLIAGGPPAVAADPASAPIAGQPWLTFVVPRLDRALDGVDVLLDAAERPELSELLADRYRSWRDFAGIDRTRPLGLMRTWRTDDPATPQTEQPADVLFLPVKDREEFLRTITFDTVEFRIVGEDRAEIDRPSAPYHVLFHDGYAWLGDDIPQLLAFARRREQILQPIPATADCGLVLDFDQVPPAGRAAAVAPWLALYEPLLQQRDSEPAAVYAWRRTATEALVRGLPQWINDVQQLVLTQTLRPDRRQSEWTGTMQFRRPSDPPWWPARPTPLARLDVPEALSSGVIRWRGQLSPPGEPPAEWELGWQLFGQPFGQREAVVVVEAPGLADLVAGWPVTRPGELPLGDGVMRRISPPATPFWLRRFVGWDPEAWVGMIDGRLWIGFGPPENLRPRLQQAHDRVAAPSGPDDPKINARIRLSARDVVHWLPGFNRGWADQQLARGGEQMRLSVESQPQRLTVRATVDVGVLRLAGAAIAHELSLELDQLLALPPDSAN